MIKPVAQYGTNLISSDNLALLRGAGYYNPEPKYEQSTNRGPAYDNALNYYQNFGPSKSDNNMYNDKPYYMENDMRAIQPSDVENKRDYQVGSTMFHSESNNSWSRPDFNGSRGLDQYQAWAVNSMNITPSALLNFFFSEDNVNYIQDTLIKEVQRIRNVKISKQSVDELLIIMRNKYMYALSGYLDNPYGPIASRGEVNRQGLAYYKDGLTEQLTKLNQSVVEECLKQILSAVGMYLQYYKDASSLPMPLSHPVLTSEKGSRILQENVGFTSGHQASKDFASYNERFNIL